MNVAITSLPLFWAPRLFDCFYFHTANQLRCDIFCKRGSPSGGGQWKGGGHILVNKSHWRCIFGCLYFRCKWLWFKGESAEKKYDRRFIFVSKHGAFVTSKSTNSELCQSVCQRGDMQVIQMCTSVYFYCEKNYVIDGIGCALLSGSSSMSTQRESILIYCSHIRCFTVFHEKWRHLCLSNPSRCNVYTL